MRKELFSFLLLFASVFVFDVGSYANEVVFEPDREKEYQYDIQIELSQVYACDVAEINTPIVFSKCLVSEFATGTDIDIDHLRIGAYKHYGLANKDGNQDFAFYSLNTTMLDVVNNIFLLKTLLKTAKR